MGLIKEPRNIDFSTISEPWTEKELADFRMIMQEINDKTRKGNPGHQRTFEKENMSEDRNSALKCSMF